MGNEFIVSLVQIKHIELNSMYKIYQMRINRNSHLILCNNISKLEF